MKSSLILRKNKPGKKPSAIRITFQLEEVDALLEQWRETAMTGVWGDLEMHLYRQATIYEEQSGKLIGIDSAAGKQK